MKLALASPTPPVLMNLDADFSDNEESDDEDLELPEIDLESLKKAVSSGAMKVQVVDKKDLHLY